jgi:hypothetical protein
MNAALFLTFNFLIFSFSSDTNIKGVLFLTLNFLILSFSSDSELFQMVIKVRVMKPRPVLL